MKRVLVAFMFLWLAFHGAGHSAPAPGFSFLRMGIGAPAQGVGGAYMAAVTDVSAVHWNPAALTSLSGGEFLFYHNASFQDQRFNHAAFGQPLGGRSALAISVGHFSRGSFDGRDEAGESVGSFEASDIVANLAVARRLDNRSSLGTGLKILKSRIADYSATAWAADLSASYSTRANTRLAAGVFNLGPSVSYLDERVRLPSYLSLGAAHQAFRVVTFSADWRYGLHDRQPSLSIGSELGLSSLASLRLGYLSHIAKIATDGDSTLGTDKLSGVTAGLGVRFLPGYSLDYAFVPTGELGDTHHISLTMRVNR